MSRSIRKALSDLTGFSDFLGDKARRNEKAAREAAVAVAEAAREARAAAAQEARAAREAEQERERRERVRRERARREIAEREQERVGPERVGPERVDAILRSDNTVLVVEGARGMDIDINGIYDVTDTIQDGMPVYEKQGRSGLCIMYSLRYKQWVIKKPSSVLSRAYVACDINTLPNEATDVWFVGNGLFAVSQPDMTVTSLPRGISAVQAQPLYGMPSLLPPPPRAEAMFEELDPDAVEAILALDLPPLPPSPLRQLEKRGGRRKRTLKHRKNTKGGKHSKRSKSLRYRRTHRR